MFLLDVEELCAVLEEKPTDSATGYEPYIAIVDKYIRERSPFEVNIESKTRTEILRTTDKKAFVELTLVSRSTISSVYLPPSVELQHYLTHGFTLKKVTEGGLTGVAVKVRR